MKSLFITVVACAMSITTALCGETHTQSISFDDGVGPGNAGTYGSNDTFSVDLYLTFNGYNSTGLSLWFEASAGAAPFMSITGFTYGTTFFDPTQPPSGPVGFTTHEADGFYGTPNPSDFGATNDPPYTKTAAPPGTYFVGHLTISLAGLAPGVYTLRTDATTPHGSEVTSFAAPNIFGSEFLPTSDYTITVVPEPGTLSLIGLGAIAIAASLRRKRREVSF